MEKQTVAEILKKKKEPGLERPKLEPRGMSGRPPSRPTIKPVAGPSEGPEVRRSGRVVKSTNKDVEEQKNRGRLSRLGKRANWSVKEKQLLLRALKERMSNTQFDYLNIKREIKAKKKEDVENYVKTLREKAVAKKVQAVRKKSPIEIWSNLMKDFGDTDQDVAKQMSKAMSMGVTDSGIKYKSLATDDFKPATVYRYLGALLRDRTKPPPTLKPLESQVIVDCFQHMLETLKQCGITEQTSFLKDQYFKLCQAAYTGHGDLNLDDKMDAGLPNQTDAADNPDIPGSSNQEELRTNNDDGDGDAQPSTSGAQSSMSNGLPETRDTEASDGQLGAGGHSWSDILRFLPGDGQVEGLNRGPSYRGGPSSLEARLLNPLGIPDKLLNLLATFGNQERGGTTEDADSDADSDGKNDEGGEDDSEDDSDDDDGGGDGDDLERDNVDDRAGDGQGDFDMNDPDDDDGDDDQDDDADDGQDDIGDVNHDHLNNSNEMMEDNYEYDHDDPEYTDLIEHDESNAQGNQETGVPQGSESDVSSSPIKLTIQPVNQSEDESQSTWAYGGTSPSPRKNMTQHKSPGKQQRTPRKQITRPHFVLDPLASSRRRQTSGNSRNVTVADPMMGTSFQDLDHPDDEEENVSFMLEQKKDHLEFSQQPIDLHHLKANEVPVIQKMSSDPESSSGQLLTLDLSHLKPGANIVIPASALPGGILTIKNPDVQDFMSKQGASMEPFGPGISNVDRMTTDPAAASNIGDPRAGMTMSIDRKSSEPSEAVPALWDSPSEKVKSLNIDPLNTSLPDSCAYVSESPDRSMASLSDRATQDSPRARTLQAAQTTKKTGEQTREIDYEDFLLGEGVSQKKKSSLSLIRLKIQPRSQGKKKTFLQREIDWRKKRSPSGVQEVPRGLPDVSDVQQTLHKADVKKTSTLKVGVTKKGRGRPRKETPAETSHKSQFVSSEEDENAMESPASKQIPTTKRGPGRPKKSGDEVSHGPQERAHDLKEQKHSVSGFTPVPGSIPEKPKRGRPRKVAKEVNQEIYEKGTETKDSELDKENDLQERERDFSGLGSQSASGLNTENRKRGRPRKVAEEPTSKVSDKGKTTTDSEDEIASEQWEGLNSRHASEGPKQGRLAEDRSKILHSTPARVTAVTAKKVDEDSPKSQQADTRGSKESKKRGKFQKTLPEIIQELVRSGQKSRQRTESEQGDDQTGSLEKRKRGRPSKIATKSDSASLSETDDDGDKRKDINMQADKIDTISDISEKRKRGHPSKIAARSGTTSLSETNDDGDKRKNITLQETKHNEGQIDTMDISEKRKRGRPPKIAGGSYTKTLSQTDDDSDQRNDGDIKETRKHGRPLKVLPEEMQTDSEIESAPQKDGPADLSLSPGPLDLSMKSRNRSELDVRRSPRKKMLETAGEKEQLSLHTRKQEHTSVPGYESDSIAIDQIAKGKKIHSSPEKIVIAPASLVPDLSESSPEKAESSPIHDFQSIEDTSSSMSDYEMLEQVSSPSSVVQTSEDDSLLKKKQRRSREQSPSVQIDQDSSPSTKKQKIIKVPVSDVQLIRDALSGIGDVQIIEDITMLKEKPKKDSPRKRVSFANVNLPEGATFRFLSDEVQDLHRSPEKSKDIPLSKRQKGFGDFPDMTPLARKIRGRGRPKKIQKGSLGSKLNEARDMSGINISEVVPMCPNRGTRRYNGKQKCFPTASRLIRATVAEAVEITIPKAEVFGVESPLRKEAISSKDITPKTKSVVFFSLKKE